MIHLTEQFFSEKGDKAMYRKGGADYHTLRYVKWLEAKVKNFTAHNSAMVQCLCVDCRLNETCQFTKGKERYGCSVYYAQHQ